MSTMNSLQWLKLKCRHSLAYNIFVIVPVSSVVGVVVGKIFLFAVPYSKKGDSRSSLKIKKKKK